MANNGSSRRFPYLARSGSQRVGSGSSAAGMAGPNAVGGVPEHPANRALVADAAPVGNQQAVREQDRFMPIANVIRIMRRVLPTHAKISDDAKETVQECVSEYISFITSEANDRCQREQRKTITAEDIIWAMSKLGFDNYIEPLTLFLQRYREVEGDHRGSIRGDALVVKHRSVPLPSLSDLMNRNLHSPVPPPQPFHYYDVNGVLAMQQAPAPAPLQAQPSYIIPPPMVATSPYGSIPNYATFLNDGMGGGGGGGYSYGMFCAGEGTSGGSGGSSSQAASPPAPPAVPTYENFPCNSLNYKY